MQGAKCYDESGELGFSRQDILVITADSSDQSATCRDIRTVDNLFLANYVSSVAHYDDVVDGEHACRQSKSAIQHIPASDAAAGCRKKEVTEFLGGRTYTRWTQWRSIRH